jgi:O-antigen/teichoic acid export membrane protein
MGMQRERGIAGGSAVLLGAVAATSVLNYGLGLALAWLLPADRFGVVGTLIALLLLATSVLAAGFPWALARVVAAGHGDTNADTAPTFRAALVGNVGLGIVLAAAFVAIQLPTGALLPGVGPVPTLLAAATIVALALGSVQVGALQGFRRFDAVAATRVLECVAKVVLVVGAVTVLALGIGGVALALLVSAAVAAGWSLWSLRDRWPGRGPVAAARTFVDAVPLSIATTGFGMLGTLDVLLLGALGHGAGGAAAAVGIYQAAAIIGRAPFFLGSAVSEAVFPHIARARTLVEAHRVTMTALRFIPLALVPAQLVLLIAPNWALSIVLPAAYADATEPVRVITLGTVGLLVADVLLKALLARGFGGVVALRVPVAVGVQLAGLALLVPHFGPLGAAWSFAAGTWAMAALLGGAYLARFRPARPRVAPAVGWIVALGAPAGAFLAADHAGTVLGSALVLLGLACYVGLALRLGLVPADVVSNVAAYVQRRIQRTTAEARP